MGDVVRRGVWFIRMASGAIVRRYEMHLNGGAFSYTLCRVPRRRHVHLVIEDSGELQIRAPYRYSREDAQSLITFNAGWITDKLRQVREKLDARPVLKTGAELPLLDDRLVLNVNPTEQFDLFANNSDLKDGEVKRLNGELRLRVCCNDPDNIRQVLEQWYRKQAKDCLVPLLLEIANRIGVQPGRVSIRGQKTCWGSCTAKGSISLNWRLMLVPRDLAEYVLVHELCHLRFLNHSAAFWGLVQLWVPDFRKRRSLLRNAQDGLSL